MSTNEPRALTHVAVAFLVLALFQTGCHETDRAQAAHYALVTTAMSSALLQLDAALMRSEALPLGPMTDTERAQADLIIAGVLDLRDAIKHDVRNAGVLVSFVVDAPRLQWYVDEAARLYREGRAFFRPRFDGLPRDTQVALNRIMAQALIADKRWHDLQNAQAALVAQRPGVRDATQAALATIELVTELARVLR